jgi:hypothetical protein
LIPDVFKTLSALIRHSELVSESYFRWPAS